jgi:hypothetical protein
MAMDEIPVTGLKKPVDLQKDPGKYQVYVMLLQQLLSSCRESGVKLVIRADLARDFYLSLDKIDLMQIHVDHMTFCDI